MQSRQMAGHLIRRLHQLSAQVFQAQMQDAGFDLTPVQFAAMDAIAAHPGVDQASVATLIAYDRATIGGVIDRLVKKGYVRRVVSQLDRRARDLSLTELGQQQFDAATPEVWALQGAILGGLSEDERAELLALIRKAIGPEPSGDARRADAPGAPLPGPADHS